MLPPFVILAAYLLGSIPFGYLIVRLRGGGDVRAGGSGGTGATNVTRRAGKKAGVVTLALDALKGAAAVLLARALLTEDFGANWWVAGAALASVVGHCFPVWLRFRGGKGVATRYVSLGSITATALLPLCVWLLGGYTYPPEQRAPLTSAAAAGAALIVLMHRANIGRLLKGTENKFK